MQELIDITIGHYYHIDRGLAHGGMSEVYLGHDQRNNQLVALKMVKRSAGEFYERFRRETKTLASLHHAHILPALDYGEYDMWSYLVTPYIAYGTLSRKINEGQMSLDEVESILNQIANALQFAHEHGVLHRDIKASNVLLRDGTYAYLTDFGLVKSVEDEFSLTKSGFLVGTPEYMAPELVDQPATPASDIYALGILVYQMATGTVPFKGANPVSIVMKHLKETPPPPSRLNPAITPDVERVILQTLEKNPQRRFHTARAFANAFQQARHYNMGAVPLPQPTRPTHPVSINVIPSPTNNVTTRTQTSVDRRYLWVGVGVLTILIFLIILIIILITHQA